MIKKLSLFFSAIAIGILSIFTSISTKNTAEPQYFLKNTQVKNAVVYDEIENNYNLDFYFDINLPFNTNTIENIKIIEILQGQQLQVLRYYYNLEKELISEGGSTVGTDTFNFQIIDNVYGFLWADFGEFQYYRTTNGKWLNYDEEEILGFRISINSNDLSKIRLYDQNNLNNLLTPYIGNLTSLPSEEPTEPQKPIDQINTLVNDIVNWFTNIFNGLGNVFYDPTANKLTAWGTVMFIGVAIMLISMALKWVISLIRGV